jgi:ABC-type glycerol-3-phosphate transport system permease component
LNTLRIVVFTCLGTVLSCSLAAYGFSRLQRPGRDVFFVILLGTMMLPYTVTMIPVFMLFNTLKWVDTFPAFDRPFVFRQHLLYLLAAPVLPDNPAELEDAASMAAIL